MKAVSPIEVAGLGWSQGEMRVTGGQKHKMLERTGLSKKTQTPDVTLLAFPEILAD